MSLILLRLRLTNKAPSKKTPKSAHPDRALNHLNESGAMKARLVLGEVGVLHHVKLVDGVAALVLAAMAGSGGVGAADHAVRPGERFVVRVLREVVCSHREVLTATVYFQKLKRMAIFGSLKGVTC